MVNNNLGEALKEARYKVQLNTKYAQLALCLSRLLLKDLTVTSRRPPRIPLGAWPAEMQADMAAGYCDEPSVETFLSKVARGDYAQPCRQGGCLPKWHRAKLDQALARRHNLAIVTLAVAEDLSGLI